MDRAIAKNLSTCITHLDHLITTFLNIEDLSQEPEIDLYIKRVLESLRLLEDGKSVLLRLGCKEHTTLLCFTRNAFQFRLEHYNTGAGLEHHYQWQNSHLYQTHDIINAIPRKSVVNEELWQSISKLREAKNMDEAYEWLRSKIGEGGVHAPRSIHQEDYDAMQESGSCSSQAFMALMRYQAMQHQPGRPRQKEAFYKLLKTYLFLQYLQDYKSEMNDSTASYLPFVVTKLEGEQILIETSLDEKQYSNAIKKFKNAFSSLGESEIFETCSLSHQKGDSLNYYADLRLLSKLLSEVLRKNPTKSDSIELKHPIFKLGLAKLTSRLK